jgi:hypothetical protein
MLSSSGRERLLVAAGVEMGSDASTVQRRVEYDRTATRLSNEKMTDQESHRKD